MVLGPAYYLVMEPAYYLVMVLAYYLALEPAYYLVMVVEVNLVVNLVAIQMEFWLVLVMVSLTLHMHIYPLAPENLLDPVHRENQSGRLDQ